MNLILKSLKSKSSDASTIGTLLTPFLSSDTFLTHTKASTSSRTWFYPLDTFLPPPFKSYRLAQRGGRGTNTTGTAATVPIAAIKRSAPASTRCSRSAVG